MRIKMLSIIKAFKSIAIHTHIHTDCT